MNEERLREKIAEAVRRVPVRLGPNGKLMVEMGKPIYLNFTESERLADEVMEVLRNTPIEMEEAGTVLADCLKAQPISLSEEEEGEK